MAALYSAYRPAGMLDALRALVPYGGPWGERQAGHLLRRSGFGGSPQDVDRVAGLAIHHAVDEAFDFDKTAGLPESPAGLVDPRSLYEGNAAEATADDKKRVNVAYRADLMAMQTWWLERMLASAAPLQEKMTLFWHGHFTSAYREKGVGPQLMLAQNALFRSNALGNIRDLTLAVSRDPAMLRYLDNARSAVAHPNENYARELMELFTLGIGNYTENDVRESARAFTGWGVDRAGNFVENARRHDDGVKYFLGRTGNFDGNDIIDIIFAQPACARLFATKLLEFFVYDAPEPQLVDAVAELLRHNGYALEPVMRVLLRSEVFYSQRAYRALVKSPVEFVVGSLKLFDVRHVNKNVLGTLARCGQILFHPPNVKGWDGGAAWLNSQTLLTRENFANGLVNAPALRQPGALPSRISIRPDAAAAEIARIVLQDDIAPDALARLRDYLDGADTAANGMLSGENIEERARGALYLAMAMPAYQLN